jgi:type III secretory pathway component EscS
LPLAVVAAVLGVAVAAVQVATLLQQTKTLHLAQHIQLLLVRVALAALRQIRPAQMV